MWQPRHGFSFYLSKLLEHRRNYQPMQQEILSTKIRGCKMQLKMQKQKAANIVRLNQAGQGKQNHGGNFFIIIVHILNKLHLLLLVQYQDRKRQKQLQYPKTLVHLHLRSTGRTSSSSRRAADDETAETRATAVKCEE